MKRIRTTVGKINKQKEYDTCPSKNDNIDFEDIPGYIWSGTFRQFEERIILKDNFFKTGRKMFYAEVERINFSSFLYKNK